MAKEQSDDSVPAVTFEHIKNRRSKHQYENLSLGTRVPMSVFPTPNSSWSTFVRSELLERDLTFPDPEDEGLGILSFSNSYNLLPCCRIFDSRDTSASGTRESPMCGTTSISRDAMRDRSKFSSATWTSKGKVSACELWAFVRWKPGQS